MPLKAKEWARHDDAVEYVTAAENARGNAVVLRAAIGGEARELERFLDQAVGSFAAARSAIAACFLSHTVVADLNALLDSPAIRGVLVAPGSRAQTSTLCRLAVWPRTELAVIGEALLRRGVAFDPKRFTHVISVVVLQGGRLTLSVDSRELCFDRMAATSAPTPVSSAAVCRAQHKLEELRHVSPEFDALLDASARSGELLAADVGAAPGGWTWFLAQHGFSQVFAVDPAALDEHVADSPSVTHLRCMVQAVDWAAAAGSGVAPELSLLCCDMHGVDCRDEMRLMLDLTHLLRAGGLLVVTLKLPQKVSECHADRLALQCTEILEAAGLFRVRGRHWLLANRNNERTLVATKT
eukprot:g4110.t1